MLCLSSHRVALSLLLKLQACLARIHRRHQRRHQRLSVSSGGTHPRYNPIYYVVHLAILASVKLTAAPEGAAWCIGSLLSGSDVTDCGFTAAAILLRVKRDLLALDKIAHSGALKGARMHKHVFSAIVGLDEAKALCAL